MTPYGEGESSGKFTTIDVVKMDDNKPRLSIATQSTQEGFYNFNLGPSSFSLLLDELRRDDVTYSYASTLSTNYTTSNLAGPGRVLGNLYSIAGSSLERGVGSIARRTGIEELLRSKSLDRLKKSTRLFRSEDARKHRKACRIFLDGANSYDREVQATAFGFITAFTLKLPAKAQPAFRHVLKKRREIGAVISLSWKRSRIDYGLEWLFWYKLASRCLASPDNFECIDGFSLLESANRKGLVPFLQSILRQSLIMSFYEDFKSYVLKRGFGDPALFQLVSASISAMKIHCETEKFRLLSLLSQAWSSDLVTCMWDSLGSMSPNVRCALADDPTQLATWANVFRLHLIVNKYRSLLILQFQTDDHGSTFRSYDTLVSCEQWEDACHKYLPDPEYTKLRQLLLHLEDLHKPILREHSFSFEGEINEFDSHSGGDSDVIPTVGWSWK
ncbi:hypothetical protein SCHPADRAFT_927927 [Schizopora paradoxa]|uniref:Uncharacterized protein n=1 Tax=Schizopora paradoxa TaxID=27342 RepID=A0A0H2RR01_9AGAM|nr:hypothetical protein SCHPADRAFT_927927 [Schizopora paradoxa]